MLKDLPDNRFDPLTGRPLYSADVLRVALNNDVCCSGKAAPGTAFSKLGIPHADRSFTETVRRFIQGNRSVENPQNEATLYDLGLRWNTDIYCIP